MNAVFSALGRFVVKWRWVILVVWVLGTFLAVSSLPSLGSQVNNNNSAFLPASAPSNQAAALATPLIGSSDHSEIPVVAVTSNPTLDANDQAALARARSELENVPTVKSVQFLAARDDAAQLLVVSDVSPFDQTGTD